MCNAERRERGGRVKRGCRGLARSVWWPPARGRGRAGAPRPFLPRHRRLSRSLSLPLSLSPSLDHLCGVVGLRRSRQVVDVGAARSRPTLKGTSEGASAHPSAASATEQSLLRGRRRRSGQRGGRKKGRRREGRRGNELCRRRGCLLQKHGRGERRSGRAAVALARITRSRRRRRAPPSLPDVEERGRLHVRNKVRLESPSAQ